MKIMGVSCKFSLKPIHWTIATPAQHVPSSPLVTCSREFPTWSLPLRWCSPAHVQSRNHPPDAMGCWDAMGPLGSLDLTMEDPNKLQQAAQWRTNKVTNYGLINWILFCLCFTSRLGCWCINMAKLQVYWTSLCPALTVRCSTSRSLDVGDEFWSWNMKDCENCPRQRRRIRRSYKYVWMYKIYELFQLNLWFPWGYCLLQLLIFMQAFASQLAEISLQPSCMFDVFRSRCRMWQEWTFAQPAMMRNSIHLYTNTTAPHKIPVVYWVSPGSIVYLSTGKICSLVSDIGGSKGLMPAPQVQLQDLTSGREVAVVSWFQSLSLLAVMFSCILLPDCPVSFYDCHRAKRCALSSHPWIPQHTPCPSASARRGARPNPLVMA